MTNRYYSTCRNHLQNYDYFFLSEEHRAVGTHGDSFRRYSDCTCLLRGGTFVALNVIFLPWVSFGELASICNNKIRPSFSWIVQSCIDRRVVHVDQTCLTFASRVVITFKKSTFNSLRSITPPFECVLSALKFLNHPRRVQLQRPRARTRSRNQFVYLVPKWAIMSP